MSDETKALELAQAQLFATGAGAIRKRIELLKDLRGVLRSGHDFGAIPGCGPNPALKKTGAEKILIGFGLSTVEQGIVEEHAGDDVGYRVTLNALTPDGVIRGTGIGYASTAETNYAWEAAMCDEQYSDTPSDQRRTIWRKVKGKPTKIKQVRTSPEDKRNTVLKMAVKRAKVALAFDSTACAEFFAIGPEEDEGADTPAASADAPRIAGRVLDLEAASVKAWVVDSYKAAGITRDQAADIIDNATAAFAVPADPADYEPKHIVLLDEMFHRAAAQPEQEAAEEPEPDKGPAEQPAAPVVDPEAPEPEPEDRTPYEELLAFAEQMSATPAAIQEAMKRAGVEPGYPPVIDEAQKDAVLDQLDLMLREARDARDAAEAEAPADADTL